MRILISLLYYICIFFGSASAFADFDFQNFSQIQNPVVRTMEADSQYFYSFVKSTCGNGTVLSQMAVPVNSKILGLQWEAFKDTAVSFITFNTTYWKARYSTLSGDGLSIEVQRILSSPGAQVALQECYGNNENLKFVYYRMLIDNDKNATGLGIGVNLIGAALIAKVVAKVGWAAIAWGLAKRGKSEEAIKAAKELTTKIVTSTLTIGGTAAVAVTVNDHKNETTEENANLEKQFACKNILEIPESLVEKDLKHLADTKASFWKEALQDDFKKLNAAISDCEGQALSLNDQKMLEEKIKKYEQIKTEYL